MVKNKVVFITGAAQGIGYEIGKRFAANGELVVLSDIDQADAESAAASLTEVGGTVTGIKCDVTKEAELRQALESTVNLYGRIDVLINNAGLQYVAPIEEFPKEKYELLLSVMLTAPFMAIQAVFPIMKKHKFGRIINMASINGLVGFSGKAAYNSAKHGVIGLTKVAALEGAEHGITVNAVCPGYVDTPLVRNQLADLAKTRNVPLERVLDDVIFPLVPQKRLLSVEEIAHYVHFLASDEARGITGQACVIDGGYTTQ
ncbi:3-hydroxybutyrate dehydrogenase [Bacillus rubiinfantis]|uniref:3-hydroxybutyrate dehydrogenase n=1 Tax=Bacillus rubiinfantis TaxID=1499680 RepID=UPI0005AAB294|nr:3-hydroxybutyrate dehydrogenase [Bacillus rubiinfantis]